MRLGDTPVPIPNTTVKTQEADGTALETVWESRWLPEYKKNIVDWYKAGLHQWSEFKRKLLVSDDWCKSQSDEELNKDFIFCTLKTAYSENQ